MPEPVIEIAAPEPPAPQPQNAAVVEAIEPANDRGQPEKAAAAPADASVSSDEATPAEATVEDEERPPPLPDDPGVDPAEVVKPRRRFGLF